MHLSSARNSYNLSNYQRIINNSDIRSSHSNSNNNNVIPIRCRFESSLYTRPTYSWTKGNQINKHIINDSIKIKIGGEEISNKNKRTHKKRETNKIKSTKYSLITFFPINLIEQFRRIANFYFLIISIISMLIDSPVSPITSLAPLVFVISVTATKQGYEDYLRHKADNVVNRSLVTVIRNGKEMNIKCEDILQGDLVILSKDCDVPCDLVLLKTSDSNGKCFITTANLDGETNLKGLKTPIGLPNVSDERLNTLGFIECEQSKVDLYSFNGKIILSSMYHRIMEGQSNNVRINNSIMVTDDNTSSVTENIPLLAENLLLRGSRVKNTDWVIGCAVYVGQSTKMALNSRLTRSKIPSSESYINKFLIVILVIQLSTVIFCYLMKRYYDLIIVDKHPYLESAKNSNIVKLFLQDFLSFLILFNYLIPISLYVTIELHKFLGSFFMEWDRNLYDEATDQPCIVNTSDLNEELGQVNILFSDKTGTLTKNEMYFQRCSVKGKIYSSQNTKLREEESGTELDVNQFNDNIFTFFKALAICHTVQVAIKDESEMSINEYVQNVHTYDRIREESISLERNNESETDEADFVKIRKLNNSFDNNPLLYKPSSSEDETTQSHSVVIQNLRNSSSLNRKNRIYPVTEISNNGHDDDNNENEFNLKTLEEIQRPVRSFNRSTSNIDLPNSTNSSNSYLTHRRTQSYGVGQTFSQQDHVTTSKSFKELKRNLSRRESYVQPFYTQQSLLLRAESTKRKKEIKSVVEKLDYQSSSPDEKALIEAAANLGIIYTGDVDDKIKICVYPPHVSTSSSSLILQGRRLTFHRLHTIEFTSDRKRMSVIVRDNRNNIWMFTKGAESVVFPLCNASSSEMISKTHEHVNEFAKHGLRTLIVAIRKLTEDEYRNFNNEWSEANTALTDRSKLVSDCYAKIERNLDLLGATAVEDALQDDVADTLISLQAAGIKVWILTGDKIETAYNIALSCGNISPNAQKYFISDCQNEIQIREHLRIFEHQLRITRDEMHALLIDGISLTTALKHTSKEFSSVAIQCESVICCRLSPLQKCEVVQLIKKNYKNYITAAIGDGANDVSMIQEAHVGIGIVGKEGRQAARCADFSFSKFNMIKRLLLVHGHYHTYRLSMLVLYFFYKNTAFMGVQFLFQLHSMFSTESIYDSLFLTLYNVTYTALPILFLSLTEKPFKEDHLMRNPKLYMRNVFNRLLYWDKFFCWIFFGMYHAIVCFYITYWIWNKNNAILSLGPYTVGLACFGSITIHNVVIMVNFKLWMEAIYQSYIFIGTVIGSILGFILTTILYNVLDVRYDKDIYGVFNSLLASIVFWLLSILIIVLGLLPDYVIKISKVLNICQESIFPGKRKRNRVMNVEWNTRNDDGMQTTEL